MQFILHIGMPKTASTSLQATLCRLRSRMLMDARILYPTSAIPEGHIRHTAIASSLREDDFVTVSQLVRAIHTEALRVSAAKILVSDESLCGEDIEAKIPRFLDLLHDFDLRVMVYLRNPYSFLQSLLSQHIKRASPYRPAWTGTVDDFIENYLPRCNYARLCEYWASLVGITHMKVALYDKAIAGQGVICDFLERLELRYCPEDVVPDNRAANTSPPRQALRLMLALNRIEHRLPNCLMQSRVWRRLRRTVLRSNRFSAFVNSLPRSLIEDVAFSHSQLLRIQSGLVDNERLFPKFLLSEDRYYLTAMPSVEQSMA